MASFPLDHSEFGEEKPRLYNPYKDLNLGGNAPIQYYLPKSPEFLFHEESQRQRRSWSENLQYYTGSAYLIGSSAGGMIGSYSGLRAAERGESLKLRTNRVLNSGGQTGRRFGNRLGCMGMLFSGLESGIIYARGGNDDIVNSILAGLGTGALYRAGGGLRSAAIAGALGGVVAGSLVFSENLVRRYVPI